LNFEIAACAARRGRRDRAAAPRNDAAFSLSPATPRAGVASVRFSALWGLCGIYSTKRAPPHAGPYRLLVLPGFMSHTSAGRLRLGSSGALLLICLAPHLATSFP